MIGAIRDRIVEHIAAEFPYAFTPCQSRAVCEIADFLADPRGDQAFILRGYAGTGKTSLVSSVVRVWKKLNRPVVLLAPTGRAAKVFSTHAGLPAYTIHKVIYRQQTFSGENTLFQRGWNAQREALFIVDEASMVSNRGGNTLFGSGQLLNDLLEFVYAGSNCRLMFVGDTAQLPPVGEETSPALSSEWLRSFSLHLRQAELTDVVRQTEASLVLRNATHLRLQIATFDGTSVQGAYANDPEALKAINENGMPLLLCHPRKEVRIVPGDELIEQLESSYRNWGADETIIITRSNKRANVYNNGIRSRIFDRDELLNRGDLVMAVKNNYYWTSQAAAQLSEGEQLPIPFIANGDSAEIVRYHNVHSMHGFDFADATLRFLDYADTEINCRILLNTLQSESPSLTPDEAQALFAAIHEDYAHIHNQRERMKAIRQDPYYNALQIKYAYAITCHKAQGGQWREVYIDQGYLPDDADPVAYLRWLYTAITRTSGQLYLVNWPQNQSVDLATNNKQ